MRVLVSGASGLIGSALVSSLEDQGHSVVRLVRRAPRDPNESFWDPARGEIDVRRLDNCAAVVHLAGENVAGRWNEAKMLRILDSRVKGTRLLAESMGRIGGRPKVFVSASGIGFYGDRAGELLTEQSEPGAGFMAEVCREWEAASWPAAQHGLRVVNTRLGMVLSRRGGALAAMLPIFRFGLGCTFGGGRQHTSWVAIEDAVAAIIFCIMEPTLAGPVNVVAPRATTNRDFVKTLAAVMGKPAFLRAPRFVLRLALGRMADEALLSSANVLPQRLLEAGFRFTWPDLEPALKHILEDA